MADVLSTLDALFDETKNDPELNKPQGFDQTKDLADGTYYGKLEAVKFTDKNKSKGQPMATMEMSIDVDGTERLVRKWFTFSGKNPAMTMNIFRRTLGDLGMPDGLTFSETLEKAGDIEGRSVEVVVKTNNKGYQNIYINPSDEIEIVGDDEDPFAATESSDLTDSDDPFKNF